VEIRKFYSDERETYRRQDHIWFLAECARNSLDLHKDYYEVLLGTAQWLVSRCDDEVLTLGIAGGQGSGKSTFSHLLLKAVEYISDKRGMMLCLDDFYLTHAERQRLSKSIHPLLATRGVPGTHDVEMMSSVINRIRHGESVQVPEFNKAEDDRSGFRRVQGGEIDFVIFEGWCWGATATTENDLIEPFNNLEVEQDSKGIWRNYVNDQLERYQSLFDTQLSIFLQVPDIAAVLKWRWLQEQGLPDGSRKMSKSAVSEFIQYYERITVRMLAESPQKSDIVIKLDHQHQFFSAVLKD
jgi:D-glycerate 3-kinase